ncbi:MAG: hypothetical protein JST18_08880 [Bacteroidetes bacterium]|nr:hypothetical protein [Bacteroidota bacterium]
MKAIALCFICSSMTILSCTAQIFENTVVTNSTFIASSFITDNEGWLIDNNGKLWHTNNGSLAWDSSVTEHHFLKMDFTDGLHAFALEADIAYKTSDGGYTWSPLVVPGIIGKSLFFLDSQTGFISGRNTIFRTTDGGENWSTIETDDVSFLDYYFISPLLGIASAYDEESNRSLWRTTDGGLTWMNVFNERNFYMNSVWFTNETTGWAAGYYDRFGIKEPAILRTTDGGQTWKSAYRNVYVDSRGESLYDIRFRNEMEGYAISRYAYDVYTTDGGTNWYLAHAADTLGLSPQYGIYKVLDGYSDMYLIGRRGNIAIWK